MKGGGGVTQKTKNTGCSKAECNILKRPEMIENQYLHNKTPLNVPESSYYCTKCKAKYKGIDSILTQILSMFLLHGPMESFQIGNRKVIMIFLTRKNILLLY